MRRAPDRARLVALPRPGSLLPPLGRRLESVSRPHERASDRASKTTRPPLCHPRPDGSEEAEHAESLSFRDLLTQLEDMAQPKLPRRVTCGELHASGLAQRFIRTLLSPHTVPRACLKSR